MLDLLIKNARIVDGEGVARGSLAIAGSKIAARFAEGMELPPARQVIEAGDLMLLPGIVDPHVHFYGEGIGGYSRLAVMGGVTTFIGMIRGAPEEPLADVLSRHVEEANAQAVADYSFHLVLHDRDDVPGQVAAAAALGFRSFKMFLAYKRRGIMVSERFLHEAMRAIHAIGGIALIHAEVGEVIDSLEQAAMAAGHRTPAHYAPTRPPEAEAAAIETVALASEVTGCPAYIVHVSSQAGLGAVMRARARGIRLWAETCPQYILMGNGTLLKHGAVARIAPPLREAADQRSLAAALATGVINTVGSDHASYAWAAKTAAGEDIFAAPFGMPGAPLHWPSMYTWAIDSGVALPTLVRAMTQAPAQMFGLGDRKGTLLPGADADLVLIDGATRRTLDAARVWPDVAPNPLVETPLAGWPELTLSRGEIVWQNGEVVAKPPRAQQISQTARAASPRTDH